MSRLKKVTSKVLFDYESENTFCKKKRKPQNTGLVNFDLKEIHPLTDNQGRVFDSYKNNKNIISYGSAGSGKSFVILYLMLNELLYAQNYEKLIIIRSAQPTKDIGFMPGNERDKLSYYESPYYGIFTELFGRADAYEILKKKDLVEFQSSSFLRGTTFNNSLIFVDEYENLTFRESNTIITRVGQNSKICFAGDIKQVDINPRKDDIGFYDFMRIVERMEEFVCVEFTLEDCVRSGLVKSYLTIKENLDL